MKRTYSDPLMFSSILLTASGGSIVPGPSQGGSVSPDDAKAANGLVESSPALSIASGTADAALSAGGADVEIVEPEQKSEPTITEESIQSVIDQIMGEDTETPPSDESSLAD